MNVIKTLTLCCISFMLLYFCGCDSPSSNNSSQTVDREDVVGKWVRVKSIEEWDFGPDDNGHYIDVDNDTAQLVDIKASHCTFYTKLSGEYAKQDEYFSFNAGGFSASLVNDTLSITYRENEGGGYWEQETLYFIQYVGELPPGNWPTVISDETVILFL